MAANPVTPPSSNRHPDSAIVPLAPVFSTRHSTVVSNCWRCSIPTGAPVRRSAPSTPRSRLSAPQSATSLVGSGGESRVIRFLNRKTPSPSRKRLLREIWKRPPNLGSYQFTNTSYMRISRTIDQAQIEINATLLLLSNSVAKISSKRKIQIAIEPRARLDAGLRLKGIEARIR